MLGRLATVGVVLLGAAPALATPVDPPAPRGSIQLTGQVLSASSRWTADRSRIITDAVVERGDGTKVSVSQLGGTVDGLTMKVFDDSPLLVPGLRVAIAAHAASSALRGATVAVDAVVVQPESDFVRTGPTVQGHFLWWGTRDVPIVDAQEGTTEIAGDAEFGVIDSVIANWNTSVSDCSNVEMVSTGRADQEVGNDGINVIKFRDTEWCRPGLPDDPMRCHDPTVVGLTTVTYINDTTSVLDGEIKDADVEINGVGFSTETDGMTLGTQACHQDLANTLTHELGHLLGLAHTCRFISEPAVVDNAGRPVPFCSDTTDPAILDATMYPGVSCDQTSLVSLTADDVAAVCAAYPLPASGGCDTGHGNGGAAVVGGLGALLLFWRARARPRARV